MNRLTPRQLRQLYQALLESFTRDEMRQLVFFRLGENLEVIVGNGPNRDIFFDLIQWAERHGRTTELVDGAYEANPDNAAIRKLHEDAKQWFHVATRQRVTAVIEDIVLGIDSLGEVKRRWGLAPKEYYSETDGHLIAWFPEKAVKLIVAPDTMYTEQRIVQIEIEKGYQGSLPFTLEFGMPAHQIKSLLDTKYGCALERVPGSEGDWHTLVEIDAKSYLMALRFSTTGLSSFRLYFIDSEKHN